MTYGKSYRSTWKNVEGQTMILNIWDRLVPALPNPRNFHYTVVDNGNGTETVTVSWDYIIAANSVLFSYFIIGDDIITNVPGTNPIGPKTFTIPTGNYHFRATVSYPLSLNIPNEVYGLNDLEAQIIPIIPGSKPLELSVINNEEDLFGNGIEAKQADFTALSTPQFNLSNFNIDDCFDDRFYVTVEKNVGNFIFKGFLILDDLSEPFLSPKNEIKFKATDRLGTLKEVPLLKFDGTNPRGKNRIIDYICWALNPTGLSLPINVVMNLREISVQSFFAPATFADPARFITFFRPLFSVGRKIKISGTASNNVTGVITLVDGPIVFGPFAGQYTIFFDSDIVNLVAETAPIALFEGADAHMYQSVYLDAKTFETEINVSENGYSVLGKLFGDIAVITQEKGEWWIKRHSESDQAKMYITRFDAQGNYLEDLIQDQFLKDIVRESALCHVNKQTGVELARAKDHITETYRYVKPKELLCNIDYARGAVINAPDLSLGETTGTYALDCWDYAEHNILGNPANPAPAGAAYIKRTFINGHEDSRVIEMTTSNAARFCTLKSEGVYVEIGSKIIISERFRWDVQFDATAHITNTLGVELVADDGTYWRLFEEGQWFQYFVTPSLLIIIMNNEVQDGTDQREWHSIQVESEPMPRSGKLYVYLANDSIVNIHGVNSAYIQHSGLSLEIIPFINGTYQKFNGHSWTITKAPSPNGKYLANRENEIFISNSPSRTNKGALLVKSGDDYLPAAEFYDMAKYPNNAPPSIGLWPYGWHQAFEVYHQFNRSKLSFRATLKGLSGSDLDASGADDTPGLLHTYRNLDPSPHGHLYKYYHLISFRQDLDRGVWSGVFKEVADTRIPKVFDNNLVTFKYLEE